MTLAAGVRLSSIPRCTGGRTSSRRTATRHLDTHGLSKIATSALPTRTHAVHAAFSGCFSPPYFTFLCRNRVAPFDCARYKTPYHQHLSPLHTLPFFHCAMVRDARHLRQQARNGRNEDAACSRAAPGLTATPGRSRMATVSTRISYMHAHVPPFKRIHIAFPYRLLGHH